MILFSTEDGSDETVLFVTLQIISPMWFRMNLLGALGLMTNESNWTMGGTATVGFARDKAVEMVNSITFSESNPMASPYVGEIRIFAGWASIPNPSAWLACMGQTLAQALYPELYAKIGTTYGNGDGGGSTFSLPNISGRFIVGSVSDTQSPFDDKKTGGEIEHTLTINEIPAHTHTVAMSTSGQGSGGGVSVRVPSGTVNTGSIGGGAAHNNLPPYIAMPVCIWTGRG